LTPSKIVKICDKFKLGEHSKLLFKAKMSAAEVKKEEPKTPVPAVKPSGPSSGPSPSGSRGGGRGGAGGPMRGGRGGFQRGGHQGGHPYQRGSGRGGGPQRGRAKNPNIFQNSKLLQNIYSKKFAKSHRFCPALQGYRSNFPTFFQFLKKYSSVQGLEHNHDFCTMFQRHAMSSPS